MIKDSDLTKKQLMFSKEYLISMNSTESAIKAGFSKHTASSQGSRLLKNVKVRAYVDEQLLQRASKLDITPNRILEELGHIAFFDISNIFNGYTLKEIDQLPENVRRAINSVKVREEKGQAGEVMAELTEFKTNDKLKALEMLGKHLGMFIEKKEISMTGEIEVTKLPAKETE